jgi:hypothetical protein
MTYSGTQTETASHIRSTTRTTTSAVVTR